MLDAAEDVLATCHCGAVSIRLRKAPAEITHCNCSLCRRYGVLWAYYAIAEVTIETKSPTDTYAWGGKNVDFHRCSGCGCVTHWEPLDPSMVTKQGVNLGNFHPALIAAVRVRKFDGANTWRFFDELEFKESGAQTGAS